MESLLSGFLGYISYPEMRRGMILTLRPCAPTLILIYTGDRTLHKPHQEDVGHDLRR